MNERLSSRATSRNRYSAANAPSMRITHSSPAACGGSCAPWPAAAACRPPMTSIEWPVTVPVNPLPGCSLISVTSSGASSSASAAATIGAASGCFE
jgi:hypothetical protein